MVTQSILGHVFESGNLAAKTFIKTATKDRGIYLLSIERVTSTSVIWGGSSTSLATQRGGKVIRSTMRSKLALAVAIGTAAASVLGAGSATAAPRPSRHALPGSQPRWLGKARATGGAPAAADQIQFGVLLKMRDSAAAEAKLASVSDPASANYGRWLTTGQFKAQYAPASADVDA